MSKALYVPAIGEQFNSVWNRQLNYNGFDMKWFGKNSHFQHNISLQSIYYAKEGVFKNQNYRDAIQYPKDKLLISDSGGFQIASFKKKGEKCNLNPINSLRWQEEFSDIGMNLDIPPNLDGNPTYQDFVSALDESAKNFEMFEKERKNYNMKLYNVLHGENLKLADTWYNRVKQYNFDGWAIGMKPPYDPMIQAFGFMYLYEKGEFDKASCYGTHFFGTSGKHVVPTITYCANLLKNKVVSYDSSSYNIGSIYRTFYSPFDLGPTLSFGDKFKTENPNITDLPCSCPVCQSIKDVQELNKSDIYAGTLLSLHNLYQYKQYNDVLNGLVKQRDKFVEYLKVINISDKTLISLDFIDFALANGVEKAYAKYNSYLVPNELNTRKQKTIFNF